MSNWILISVAIVLIVAAIVSAVFIWQRSCRIIAELRGASLSVAQLRHELSMDAAVFMAKLTATEAAVTWVRANVDQHASRVLVSEVGADGYDRYLIDLHRRVSGR